ncbi:hypothetical protein TNCV_1336921 [Trichonephila clavipes]|nr:hypothetical protein TNCV_1336921 [Trichonephila clavipes]
MVKLHLDVLIRLAEILVCRKAEDQDRSEAGKTDLEHAKYQVAHEQLNSFQIPHAKIIAAVTDNKKWPENVEDVNVEDTVNTPKISRSEILQDALFICYKQSPDNEHSVAFYRRSSSLHLIEDETFDDSDIINNLINYEDEQEARIFESGYKYAGVQLSNK